MVVRMKAQSADARVRYAVLLLLLGLAAIAFGLLPPDRVGATRGLAEGWQYRWSDAQSLAPLDDAWDAPGWMPIALPAHPPRKDASILWLRVRLPAASFRDPFVAIDAVLAPFEAYVGPKRVHVHPSPDGLASHVPPGVPWQLVPVVPGSADRVLSLRIRNDGPALLRGTPLYGERADHLAWALKRDVPRLACGCVIVLIALLALVTLVKKNDWRVPLGFSVWTTMIGLYVINYTHAKDILFDAPRTWFSMWLMLLPLMPIGGLLFVDGLFGTGPRGLLRRLLRFHVGYAAMLVVVDAVALWLYATAPHTGAVIFFVATTGLRILLGVSFVAACVVIGKEARRGNAEARIFLIGFVMLMGFGMTDLLAAFGVAAFSWRSLVHFGALAMTVALAMILQRRYVAAHERAAAFAGEVLVREREKERLLRDLHDGVGGLTSNIRILAELGQRSDARAKQSLVAIAELSGKSLAELRAFVQALDDTNTTWETLAAELRRFGAQLVESAGITFTMQIALAATEAPPGLLTIHVLRVFQESLTNALKQRVTTIRASLRVDAASAELVVESEGGEGAKTGTGIDAGRGLVNMRARADEVGGTFSMDRGAVARVRLYVPLPMATPTPRGAS
jgi:signal transduction histidine kinase